MITTFHNAAAEKNPRPTTPAVISLSTARPPISVPPMRLTSSAVFNSETNVPILVISTRSSSSQETVIIRTGSGQAMGTFGSKIIQAGLVMSSELQMTLAGRPATVLKHGLSSRPTYSFEPCCFPGRKWYWARDGNVWRLADDPKGGQTIATVDGEILHVAEGLGFGESVVDEIVLSALAVVNKSNKKKTSSSTGVEVGFQVLGQVLGGFGS